VLVVAFVSLSAAPASGVITNVQPFNGNQEGISEGEIFDNEELQAYVTSPSGGEICLQRYEVDPPPCSDGGYLLTPVLPFFAGFVPIAPGDLMPGRWRVVASEGEGDLATVTATSLPFWVRPCKGACPTADVTPSTDFKAQAVSLATTMKRVCGMVKAASMLWRAREAAAGVNLAVASITGGGPLTMTVMIGFYQSGKVLGTHVVKGEDLNTKLPGMLNTVYQKACKLADKTLEAAENSWLQYAQRWGADPPDPQFTTIARPDFVDHESILGYPSWGFDRDRDNLDAVRAYAKSSLHSYERFQWAELVPDPTFVHAHASRLGADMLGYASSLRRGAWFLNRTAARVRAEHPDATARTITQQELDTADEIRDRLAATGFNAEETATLEELGVNAAGIDRLRHDMTVGDPSDAQPAAIDAEIDLLAGEMRGMAEEAELFGRAAGVAAGRDDMATDAAFQYDVPDEAGNLQVTFRDTTLSQDHDPYLVTWDFGDGHAAVTRAGDTIRHTYAANGTYAVTQRVETTYDSASETQQVTPHPNKPPSASFTATPETGEAPLTVSLDAGASTDTEGGALTYLWMIDGSIAGSGAVLEHEFPLGRREPYEVKLTVTDPLGATASAKRSIRVRTAPQAPAPSDDVVTVRRAGVVDVLNNDSDPDSESIMVTDATDPEHGTVECSQLGACLYTADTGYSGQDSFTYTAADPGGLTASAPVSVTVEDPPVPTRPQALLDAATLPAGGQATLEVLDNDVGSDPRSLSEVTDPPHGQATCEPDGTCTYVPDVAFSGRDGFRYELRDGAGQTDMGEVRVTVLPADAKYTTEVDGPADPMPSGAAASWEVGVRGATHQPPQTSAQIAGPHQLDPGSIKRAEGWSGSGLDAQADGTALLGDERSLDLVKPLTTLGTNVGGDGFVPILVGNRVFSLYHLFSPTSVVCVDRETNELCPGYPVPINAGGGKIPGPGVVIGNRIYVRVWSSAQGSYAMNAPISVFCWDTATAKPCGLINVDRVPGPSDPTASAVVEVGGKLYVAGQTGRLYCIDPVTHALCPSRPTGLGETPGQDFDILADGSRVYVATQAGRIACLDIAAGMTCAGWTLPKRIETTKWNLVKSPDGICATKPSEADCWSDAAPATATRYSDWPMRDDYWSVTQEVLVGSRTYLGSYPSAGLACWDWATREPCAGGQFEADGWLPRDVEGAALPDAYGVQFDGSCLIGLGDSGFLFTADPKGFAPCGATSGEQTLDLRDQRCDGTAGAATWDRARLVDDVPHELGAVRVSVYDAATGERLAFKNVVDGALDLSEIDAKAHPALRISGAVLGKPARDAWADAIPPRLIVSWNADPAQLCFRTTTQAACDAQPISTTAGGSTKQVTLQPVGCPTPTPSATAVSTTAPPATPTPGPAVLSGSEQLLACSDRRVVLEDVLIAGNRVRLLGVADRRLYAGRRVDLLLAGRPVASARVAADGRFGTTAPLPPRKRRGSARYQARIGTDTSLNLKLVRRMSVTRLVASSGRVTITGSVVKPLAPRAKDRTITLQRIVACTRAEKVSTLRPRSSGKFSVTVSAPPGQRAAVYRFATKVPRKAGSRKLTNTFTLPRAVDFR
jgi:hypothetical protein